MSVCLKNVQITVVYCRFRDVLAGFLYLALTGWPLSHHLSSCMPGEAALLQQRHPMLSKSSPLHLKRCGINLYNSRKNDYVCCWVQCIDVYNDCSMHYIHCSVNHSFSIMMIDISISLTTVFKFSQFCCPSFCKGFVSYTLTSTALYYKITLS